MLTNYCRGPQRDPWVSIDVPIELVCNPKKPMDFYIILRIRGPEKPMGVYGLICVSMK